jgi:superfamily II DNA or RNA helicase
MPLLDINTLALWPHQRSAVVASDEYFGSGSVRSALIHMPTGTGKTGIMATVSTRRAQHRPILVVCPSIALVHQLITDFRTGFWDKIGAPRIWAPEQTLHLTPTRLNDVVAALTQANDQRKVVFATVQTLQQIHTSPDYSNLEGLFGTVLFDEGHREACSSLGAGSSPT